MAAEEGGVAYITITVVLDSQHRPTMRRDGSRGRGTEVAAQARVSLSLTVGGEQVVEKRAPMGLGMGMDQ